jgi:preprotein translocase subunit SecA
MEHFDVQLLGGCAMAEGHIAEMATGEGKTITATLPLFLFSLYERGAHLVTANDYLAERDANWVRPMFDLLGMSVGSIVQNSSESERARAYQCDLTYGTLREFAFDFLRDRLRSSQDHHSPALTEPEEIFSTPSSKRSRIDKPFFLLVDEADSLLIDEARTPLIISLPCDYIPALSDECFLWAADAVRSFRETRDYELDSATRTVHLTSAGRERLRTQLLPDRLVDLTLQDAEEAICRAIAARINFRRDEDYLIADDQIRLIDEFTGRITFGRQLRHGMHQALEALEGITLTKAQEPAARITVRDFAARYPHIAGMTGTASEVSRELKTHFDCRVVPIPTNRPCCREILPVQIFESSREKHFAIAEEVRSLTGKGRPVLIGTRTIQHSHSLSEFLNESGIEHSLLNGVQDRDEADIISQAGQRDSVTVATNMAGRGTDILLSDEVRAAGGLHVIGTEFHESARIDRQLAGRAARQGDPGSFRQMACFEDSLLVEAWGREVASELRQSARNGFRLRYAVSLFRQAQRDLERRHRRERALLFESERQRQTRNLEMGRDPWLDDVH